MLHLRGPSLPSLLHHPRCIRHPPLPLHIFPAPHSARHASSLTSRILPPAIHFRRRDPERKVRRTKPLPLSPSRLPQSARYRRIFYYTLAFLVSGGVTYTALQPDNFVNHVVQGFIRCSRVTWALARCVYDYRMTMRRVDESEDETRMRMSECHLRCAHRALVVFEKNGGIYIKLGQHLAALSYLIPIVMIPFGPNC